MTDRRDLTDVADALGAVASQIAWPEPPDLAGSVGSALRTAGPMRRRGTQWLRSPAIAYAAIVIAIVGAVATIPTARRAVADFLGVGGIDVRYSDEDLPEIAAELDLGISVGLEEARARVDFEIRIPAALGDPDAVFVDASVGGGAVWTLWGPRAALPRSETVDAGALMTQFRGVVEQGYLKKLTGASATVELVRVDGVEGYWVEGPHSLVFRDDDGISQEPARLAGNTLAWEKDGITYRLESSLSRSEAIAIADSIP